jgi:hypothetical protein
VGWCVRYELAVSAIRDNTGAVHLNGGGRLPLTSELQLCSPIGDRE